MSIWLMQLLLRPGLLVLVEGDERLKRFQQLSRDGIAWQQASHDGVGNERVVDTSVVAVPQVAGLATVECVDVVAQLGGTYLAAPPAFELCLQLAERLAKLGLVSLRCILTDKPLHLFGIFVHGHSLVWSPAVPAQHGYILKVVGVLLWRIDQLVRDQREIN